MVVTQRLTQLSISIAPVCSIVLAVLDCHPPPPDPTGTKTTAESSHLHLHLHNLEDALSFQLLSNQQVPHSTSTIDSPGVDSRLGVYRRCTTRRFRPTILVSALSKSISPLMKDLSTTPTRMSTALSWAARCAQNVTTSSALSHYQGQ